MIKALAAFEPRGKLRPFEYDPGELGHDEVEIDVHYCGICHSDVSVLDNEWGHTQYPVVAGHEIVGTISKVGAMVTKFKVDQVVGLGWNKGFCNECTPCNTGDKNLCRDAKKTILGNHGGFSEKVRAQANSVITIPEGIDLESAGPLFCAGISVFNPLVQFNIHPTHKVAVIGIGGLGHLALQYFKAWGCEVTAFTSSEFKKQEALSLGAHHTIDSRDLSQVENAKPEFDFILSTVNVKLDWNAYISMLKPHGRLHFVGATLDPIDINVFPMIMGQYTVSGSPGGSISTIAEMLEFTKRHNIKPTIEKYGFHEIDEAIDRVRSGDARYRVVLCR